MKSRTVFHHRAYRTALEDAFQRTGQFGFGDLWKWTIRQPSGRFAMTNVARPSEVIVFPSLVREEALKPVKSTAVSERTMDE